MYYRDHFTNNTVTNSKPNFSCWYEGRTQDYLGLPPEVDRIDLNIVQYCVHVFYMPLM